ncbi:MAG: PAS domain S-box protein [bacterium]|nr:PAS domain S-box protein [bacterium]
MSTLQDAVRILIVEADPESGARLAERLAALGYETAAWFADGASARKYLNDATRRIDLALVDTEAAGDPARLTGAGGRQLPVICMAPNDPGAAAAFERVRALNPYACLVKPIRDSELRTTIELALQRHRREQSLAKAEDWYPLAGRTNLEGFWHWEIDANQMSLTSRSSFLQDAADRTHTIEDYIARLDPEDRENFQRDLNEHLAGDSPLLDHVHRVIGDEGSIRWIQCTGIANRDAAGVARSVSGSIGDITGRKETEESLSESRRFIQGITEAIPAILYTYDIVEQRIISINQLAEKILGYSTGEIVALGREIFDRIVLPEDRHRFPARQSSYARTEPGAILESEVMLVSGGGERRWLSIRELVYIRDSDGRPLQVIGTAQDITRRKDAELDLIQEKEWQIVTLHSLDDGVITTDRQGRIISMNPAARRLCGFQSLGEAAGRGIDEIYALVDERSGDRLPCPVKRALREDESVEYFAGLRMHTEDGRKPNVSLTANLLRDDEQKTIGAVAVLRDETEKVRTEREMRKIQALDSLGILAGGIAHDFNNVMTAIQNHISLARMHLHEKIILEHRLREAEKALNRVRGLTRQLLTFARGGDPIKRTVAVGELVRESADFVRQGSSAQIEYGISPELWPADLDETQFSAVINNLVINAIHAMPDGGRIWIHCENVEHEARDTSSVIGDAPLQKDFAELFPNDFPQDFLTADHYLRISILDEGGGISPENLDRIFDPYFTTKETGNGLGLASAYSIIKRHAGLLRAHSIPGRGTRFQIFMPARPGASVAARDPDSDDESEDFAAPLPGAKLRAAQSAPPERDAGRILIMDDEEDIRETLGLLLERMGYAVVEADSGQAAVEQFQIGHSADRAFDLVILDLTVPGGMGGLDAARAMQSIGGKARFIASSGYSNDPVIANYADYGFAGSLAKPFRMKELSQLIEDVLSDSNKDASRSGDSL